MEACLRLGIEPSELHFMPMDIFLNRFKDRELAEIAYTHHETMRQVCIPAISLISCCHGKGMLFPSYVR